MHQPVKIFTGQVLFSAQKHVQDKVALGRTFEALLLNLTILVITIVGASLRRHPFPGRAGIPWSSGMRAEPVAKVSTLQNRGVVATGSSIA